MKKFVIVLMTVIVLSGCSAQTTDDIIDYHTDETTGCDYLIYDGYKAGGITPRMNADGTQYCKVVE